MFVYDFNDYDMGKCYNLFMINIFIDDVKINDEVLEVYCGLDCFDVCK